MNFLLGSVKITEVVVDLLKVFITEIFLIPPVSIIVPLPTKGSFGQTSYKGSVQPIWKEGTLKEIAVLFFETIKLSATLNPPKRTIESDEKLEPVRVMVSPLLPDTGFTEVKANVGGV